VSGVVLLLAPEALNSWHIEAEIASSLAKESGVALMVAGLLAASVDGKLKRALTEDVFKVTLGYPLPQQLRSQLEWLYSQRFICTICNIRVWLEEAGDHVNIRVRIFRRVENHSAEVQPFRPFITVQHILGRTKIDSLKITLPDRTYSIGDKHDDHREFDIERRGREILISPGEYVDLEYEWSGIRRIPDSYDEVFVIATKDVRVDVTHPPGLMTLVDIPTEKPISSHPLGPNREEWRLQGTHTILPYVVIALRWWRDGSLDGNDTGEPVQSLAGDTAAQSN